ncbi:MAG TPA: InlB B-repeat-containing protein [Thermodesulfovibrionales bacterium]|nr:InlB B-repeat-containing protein [Thermodesulfovibrionales bacterium]
MRKFGEKETGVFTKNSIKLTFETVLAHIVDNGQMRRNTMRNSTCKNLWFLAAALLLLAVPTMAAAQPSVVDPNFTVAEFATGMPQVRGISIDPLTGDVYTIGKLDGNVYKMSAGRTLGAPVVIPGEVLTTLPIVHHVGPYFDPVSRDLFVVDFNGGWILRINSVTGATSNFYYDARHKGTVTSDESGNIYFTVFEDIGQVLQITRNQDGTYNNGSGAAIVYAQGLNHPDGLDFGPQGELYVANRNNDSSVIPNEGQIMRVPPGGGIATVFASGFTRPIGVSSDSAGNVYVPDFDPGDLYKVTPNPSDGGLTGVVSLFGSGFSSPLGIDFDSGENIFIADFFAGKVYVLDQIAFTVTYAGNGNTGGTVPTDPNAYLSGATVTVLGNTGGLTNTGYSFAGWNTAANGSGTSYAPGATFAITGNTTLYAQWTALPTFTVTYAGNGNTGGTVPTDPNAYLSGATVTVLGNTGGLTRTGYTFAGWNTAANGGGTNYVGGNTFVITGNTTLYAKWTNSTTTVQIDIKPGSFPSSINPTKQGVTPVAIQTTSTFNANTVDPMTVRFGRTGTEAAPVHYALSDWDHDGDVDMVLHFETLSTGIKCGDTSAFLTGKTYSGQTINGTDAIKTAGCK